MLRDGLVSILHEQPDFEVVGEAGSVAGAIETVLSTQPDLVLMDYSLPDGNGLDATKAILAENPQIEIVILTVHEEDDLLFNAVRSGAKGYLLKNISAKEMIATLQGLSRGDAALMPAQTRSILSEFAKTSAPQATDLYASNPLTERELEVLELIAAGATNREIGIELHISPYTVKNHVHNILNKLQVDDRHEAAKVAVKQRLISAR